MDRVMEENMETNDPERLRVVMRVYMEQQEKKNHNWRRQVSSAKATVAELTRENRALSQQVAEPRFSGRGKNRLVGPCKLICAVACCKMCLPDQQVCGQEQAA